MKLKVGIDVGGTFTDFIVAGHGSDLIIHKVLSTPQDPSIGVLTGLKEIAALIDPDIDVKTFIARIDTIVHGTTVTTNATLTHTGAISGLVTTKGMRDALEMRRGIRERQYDNHYTNVRPLVARYLRAGVGGRLDRQGKEIERLSVADIRSAIELFKAEGVEAVSICLMNSFANPEHEKAAADLIRQEMPGAYLTVSTDLRPSIRFYERVSTTVLNSYVGPKLNHYLDQLVTSLEATGFQGVLLIVQSNGGVISPQLARERAALTLLSGPAGGPAAGLFFARAVESDRCIITDMGGTSFEASAVNGEPTIVSDGEIARHKIALPMLDIHTIGAGGGSIGWLDEGGLLRVGPQSAGAAPGPACYNTGGVLPTTTDANLVLGYLDPGFFAGGKMRLEPAAARRAIESHIAKPMGLTVEQAAAGMYRVACNNMAQGVREVTIKRGFDPREFPYIAAGGAGPIHSCLICSELDIPLQIVPSSSSVLCAFGMLLSDLRHDFVQTLVAKLDAVDWDLLNTTLSNMRAEGDRMLEDERVPPHHRKFVLRFDCRYVKQYHEVSFVVPWDAAKMGAAESIASIFHDEHRRLFGYSLEVEKSPIELINIRVQAIGTTEKPVYNQDKHPGLDIQRALKGHRTVYIPETSDFDSIPVYNGHLLARGAQIAGPSLVEFATTTAFASARYDGIIDQYRSLIIYHKGREDLVRSCLEGEAERAIV